MYITIIILSHKVLPLWTPRPACALLCFCFWLRACTARGKTSNSHWSSPSCCMRLPHSTCVTVTHSSMHRGLIIQWSQGDINFDVGIIIAAWTLYFLRWQVGVTPDHVPSLWQVLSLPPTSPKPVLHWWIALVPGLIYLSLGPASGL